LIDEGLGEVERRLKNSASRDKFGGKTRVFDGPDRDKLAARKLFAVRALRNLNQLERFITVFDLGFNTGALGVCSVRAVNSCR